MKIQLSSVHSHSLFFQFLASLNVFEKLQSCLTILLSIIILVLPLLFILFCFKSFKYLFIQFESWLLQLLKLKIWPTYCLYVTFVDAFFVDHWARILFCKLFGVSYVWYIEHFCLSLSLCLPRFCFMSAKWFLVLVAKAILYTFACSSIS